MTPPRRSLDRDRPAQPRLLRGRRHRAAPRGGRLGRWLARLRRDRSGRRAARASSIAVARACSRRPASRPGSSPTSSRTRAPRPSSAAPPRCAPSGWAARSSSPVGGGSSMDTAKALDLRAANDLPVWELEYDGPDLAPGPADRRRPDHRRHRRRDQLVRASSPTRRPGARATSAIRRCCRWRRSSTRC